VLLHRTSDHRPLEEPSVKPFARGALRRFDRWTLRTFNPMPAPFGLGRRTH
jgi:hypothetical protein